MTHVITEACIKCKYTTCVEVCPVDCFHEGANMLVIDPEVCIDCGVCVPECPINAIQPDTEPDMAPWVELNNHYAAQWPKITETKSPLPEAERWKDVKDKKQYLES